MNEDHYSSMEFNSMAASEPSRFISYPCCTATAIKMQHQILYYKSIGLNYTATQMGWHTIAHSAPQEMLGGMVL
jgi:hypothetical protein